MGENSKIEWCDHTFNPWIGCTKVGPGCDNCYAEEMMDHRYHRVTWGGTRARTSDANWRKPLAWNRAAEKAGKRARVFCASLADVFDNAVPRDWRLELWMLIEQTPHLDWQLLTKRIGNASDMIEMELPNVWIGATVVTQDEADRDIPRLLATPARVRFLSMEPLLGPVDLHLDQNNDLGRWDSTGRELPLRRVDWVIVGGESGGNARPMHPEWARSLRDQCAAAQVPCFFKQWGEWRPICQGGGDWFQYLYRSNRVAREGENQDSLDDVWGQHCIVDELCLQLDGEHCAVSVPGAWTQDMKPVQAFKVGKKSAGRLLDGREHNEFPRPREYTK